MLLLLCACSLSLSQTITRLNHQPPGGAILTFQLTDGTVMAQGNNDSSWWKLTPDNTGSYINGTWTQTASLPAGYVPDAFASAVLGDGRLVIVGGEYNNGAFTLTNLGAIYDPALNTWTSLAPPQTWSYIGDSPAVVLPNGKFLVGNKLTKQIAALDPKTLTWQIVPSAGKADFDAEEGWTLLPNGTVLTADVKAAPNSEIYTPTAGAWASAGSTIVDLHSPSPFGCIHYGPGGKLCYYPPGEIGPAILRPDGTVFVTGSYTSSGTGAGHTAIYSPTSGWSVGPDFPNGDNAGDSFAALLPSGNVLVEGDSGTSYEFNGTTLTKGPRHAVQRPVASRSIRRRVRDSYQLPADSHHQQQHRPRLLCEDPQPQHHGRRHRCRRGFHELRRSRRNGDGSKLAGSGREWNPVGGRKHHGELAVAQ